MILLQIITNYYEWIRILAKGFILMKNVLLKSIYTALFEGLYTLFISVHSKTKKKIPWPEKESVEQKINCIANLL